MDMSTYVFTTYLLRILHTTNFSYYDLKFKRKTMLLLQFVIMHYMSSLLCRTSDFDANVYVDILKFLTMALKCMSINSVIITACHYISSRLSNYIETSRLPRGRTR